MKTHYVYSAKITRVVDGDTVDAAIDLGFGIVYDTRLRLNGIDTPELTSSDPTVREKAQAAKKYLIDKLLGAEVTLQSYKADKYGRYLADILTPVGLINKMLLDEGLAVPYFGGKKE